MECHKHDAGLFTVSALCQSQLKINDKVSNFRTDLFLSMTINSWSYCLQL